MSPNSHKPVSWLYLTVTNVHHISILMNKFSVSGGNNFYNKKTSSFNFYNIYLLVLFSCHAKNAIVIMV